MGDSGVDPPHLKKLYWLLKRCPNFLHMKPELFLQRSAMSPRYFNYRNYNILINYSVEVGEMVAQVGRAPVVWLLMSQY